MRAWFLRGAAIFAVPVALALVFLAFGVLRTPGAIEADDARFHSAPLRQTGLWDDVDGLPAQAGTRLVGAEDDLAYRRTLAFFKRLRPGEVAQVSDPERENEWAKLQFDLTTRSREESNPGRRSELQNLLGVLSLARFLYSAPEERDEILKGALGSFRNAVELDPGNEDAKVNLELALRTFSGILTPSNEPTGGAARGRLSGQGASGGGY
jgi:hypothetical protein